MFALSFQSFYNIGNLFILLLLYSFILFFKSPIFLLFALVAYFHFLTLANNNLHLFYNPLHLVLFTFVIVLQSTHFFHPFVC